jgi:hypothetical protein
MLVFAGQAADPPANDTKPPAVKDAGKVGVRPLDLWKYLPGAVFVLGDEMRDALQKPGAVVLTAEEWKKLQDQIDQLKRLLATEKPITPTSVKLSGQVESTAAGDMVHVGAEFTFETETPRARVVLGCGNAWPTAVRLDESKLPEIAPAGEEGYVVRVENPGAHKLHMTMEVPVTVRGSERSF